MGVDEAEGPRPSRHDVAGRGVWRRRAAAAIRTRRGWPDTGSRTADRCRSTSTRAGGEACTPSSCSAERTCRHRPATTAMATTGRSRPGSSPSRSFAANAMRARPSSSVRARRRLHSRATGSSWRAPARGMRGLSRRAPEPAPQDGLVHGVRDLPREPRHRACHGRHAFTPARDAVRVLPRVGA